MRSIAAPVAGALQVVVACAVLAGCATRPPLAVVPSEPSGDLVVYSATFAPTMEEGEYPAHTDYTIATASDRILQHVMNRTGSFDKRPAVVRLASGEYHVRAQYDRGGFVVIPVMIEAGKITTLDLEGPAMPRGTSPQSEPIRLPDGRVVGWRSVVLR